MEMSELVRSLLAKRGYSEESAIAEFLEPDYDLHTHSPFLLEGMDRALARIFAALAANERIAIYADFDCDGIPGAAVLSDLFQKIGYSNFEVYLPHRDREGYGFHTSAIQTLADRGVSLIITVDVGTVAFEGVRFAKDKGIDVIVTDHHEIPLRPSGEQELPEAVAVLNPKLGSYPFRDLCGAAMAFKLAQAVLAEGKKRNISSFLSIQDGWEKWLLDLVAIATIADLVPLVGENRVLAHWGLRVLRKSPRPGIIALCNALRMRREELSEDDIAFSIAPRVNAASRMDEPYLALTLLTTRDHADAEKIAAELDGLNTRRKGVVAGIVRSAKKRVAERYGKEDAVVVLGDPDWKPSLLGLVANSIMEDRGGLVCIWGRDAEGRLKGSCRSDGSVSIVELFTKAHRAFVEYGGHERSGGFSVSPESVHSLPEELAAAAMAIRPREIDAPATCDAVLSLPEVSWTLFREVSRIGPFGMGNPKPLFRIADARVTEIKRFGKEKNHIELQLECPRTGSRARAFDFFRSVDDFTHVPSQGEAVGLSATLERDSYRRALALRITDVVSQGT